MYAIYYHYLSSYNLANLVGAFFIQVIRNILSEGGHPTDTAYNDMVRRTNEESRKEYEENVKSNRKEFESYLAVIQNKPITLLEELTGLSSKKLNETSNEYSEVDIPKKTGGARKDNFLVMYRKPRNTHLSVSGFFY